MTQNKTRKLPGIIRKTAQYGLVFFAVGFDAAACPPLPILLYPVNEVYAQNGWDIPDLPDDAVAVIGDSYVLKSDYKEWLYRKIGFEPNVKKEFLVKHRLEEMLREKGVDLDKNLNHILDHVFRYELNNGPFETLEAWHGMSSRIAETKESETFRETIDVLVRDVYLYVLYLMENWDVMQPALLANFRVDPGLLSVAEGDAELYPVIKVINAYAIWQRYSERIRPEIEWDMLAGQDLNLPDQTEAYIDWLYENHNTKFLVENRLGMILALKNKEAQNLVISPEVVAKEYALRLQVYEEEVEQFNLGLPASAIPLEVSPVYKEYIMTEVHDDLNKSKAHRHLNPLEEHELILRYYDAFGFDGKRSEVQEIFRWVRRQRSAGRNPSYQEYAEAEKLRIWGEMEELRTKILKEGVEDFPLHAITANEAPELQKTGGRIDLVARYDVPEERWGAVQDHVEKLEELSLHELSPVMAGPWNTIDLFWVSESAAGERVYHTISRKLPPMAAFDLEAYRRNQAAARDELQGLKKRFADGGAFEALAEEYSDSFSLHGVDISDLYLEEYGYGFAKKVSEIAAGETALIETEYGIHLIHVKSRSFTPLTDELRAEILERYMTELADQDDRYALTTLQLYEANPYFRVTD